MKENIILSTTRKINICNLKMNVAECKQKLTNETFVLVKKQWIIKNIRKLSIVFYLFLKNLFDYNFRWEN